MTPPTCELLLSSVALQCFHRPPGAPAWRTAGLLHVGAAAEKAAQEACKADVAQCKTCVTHTAHKKQVDASTCRKTQVQPDLRLP